MTTPSRQATARLHQELVLWLTTVGTEGQPQTSPVWFVWDDRIVWIASEPDAPKVANVRRHPAVSFHLEGARPGALIVTGEGRADLLATAWPAETYVTKYAEGMSQLGEDAALYLARFSAVLRVTPTRWRIFRSI